jgi:hypothetical protein
MTSKAARDDLATALHAMNEASERLQAAVDAMDGLYKPAAVIALSDTQYAQKRVGNLSRLLNASAT